MVKMDIKELMLNEQQFCNYWFYAKNGYVMQANGKFDGDGATVFSRLWMDYKEFFTASLYKMPKRDENDKIIKYIMCTERNFEHAWSIFLELEKIKAKNVLIESVKFESENDELEKWLKAVIGIPSEMQIAAIKHVLWQVKRKLIRQKPVYHLFPLFWGKQGSGKTKAVDKLVKPLESLKLDWDVVNTVDSRNAQSLADHYLCVFEEMAGADRVEMNALKKIVTADRQSFRPLYTNRTANVEQNCTFIGISNKALVENIFDSSGLRRFVEFKCLDKADWNTINTIDSYKIWKSIDENLKEGYIVPHLDSLRIHQEELQIADEFQEFLDDNNVVSDGPTVPILGNIFYTAYTAWRVIVGYNNSGQPLKAATFYKRLASAGIKKVRKHTKNEDRFYYEINATSKILKEVENLEKASLEWKQ